MKRKYVALLGRKSQNLSPDVLLFLISYKSLNCFKWSTSNINYSTLCTFEPRELIVANQGINWKIRENAFL